MPHIVLDTTAGLPENERLPAVLKDLATTLSGFESISPAAVKAYHRLTTTWAMGEGAAPGFIHCTVQVLTGRTDELRAKIADGIFARLQELFAESLMKGLAKVTVEVREMDMFTYRK